MESEFLRPTKFCSTSRTEYGKPLRHSKIGERLERLATELEGVEPRNVLVLEWTDPPFCAGHWVPDVVAAGGGRAVLGRAGHNSQRIGVEEIQAAAADVVVVAPCGYHLEAASGLTRELVAGGKLPPGAEVWAVDADSHFVRPGPRLVDGAEIMAQILHPDRVGTPVGHHARRFV